MPLGKVGVGGRLLPRLIVMARLSPDDAAPRQSSTDDRPPAAFYSVPMSPPTARATEGPVFVARLAGTGVFDPVGDPVGRVADVVILLRAKAAPRAVGLVVEVTRKRRVFVPLSRVTSIKPGAVISTGLVNLRRFRRRPSETLAFGELLDRTVRLAPDGELVVIEDVAIEQQRSRDWLVTQLFVHTQVGRGLRRRRHNQRVVPITDVRNLADLDGNQPATALLSSIEGLRPADVAEVLQELPPQRRLAVATQLRDDRLADVLEELGEEARVAIIRGLGAQRAADVLDLMQPDDAADLLNQLPEGAASALLELMEPEEAQDVRRLILYDEHSAGGLMTTEAVILPPEATVAAALAAARRSDLPPALATIFFVVRPPSETPTGRLLGVVHLQRALAEPPHRPLGELLDPDIETVTPDDEIGTLTRVLATYNLTALPVLDEEDRLLGVVSVDDVLDHLLPQDWREADEEETDTAMTRSAHG